MDDQTKNKLEFQTKIKTESQDDEIVTNEVDIKEKVKTDPLEEEASCSSIRITDSFSVSNGVPASSSSTLNSFSNYNDSIASLTDSVVNTEPLEPVFMKTESGDKDEADPNAKRDRAEIKSEPGVDNTSSNSSQLSMPCNNIKTENTTNAVKKENENSTVNQSNAGGINALPNYIPVVPPRDPSSAIANILTSSIPSTSVPRSPPNCAQANCVTSSTDEKPACRYGIRCYRLSALHRVNFFHPLGSDPLKSPEKPRCRYGTRCYRKNEEHRKRFIHDRSPDHTMSSTRKRKVKNAASQTTSVQYESDSDDSYLYEDYDGTSDEFHPDSADDTDSDETDFEPDADDSLLAA